MFVRVEVPVTPPATQLYNPEAIYCITPVTEKLAREAAVVLWEAPVRRWELPPPPAPEDIPF